MLRATDLITTTEAARYFGCSTSTIRKGIKQGIIRGVQAEDGYWYVQRGELQRVMLLPPSHPQRWRVRPPGRVVIAPYVQEAHEEMDREWHEREALEA